MDTLNLVLIVFLILVLLFSLGDEDYADGTSRYYD